jgi:hypothetical protein
MNLNAAGHDATVPYSRPTCRLPLSIPRKREADRECRIHNRQGLSRELRLESWPQPFGGGPVIDGASDRRGYGALPGLPRESPRLCRTKPFLVKNGPSRRSNVMDEVARQGMTDRRSASACRLPTPKPLAGSIERANSRAVLLPAENREGGSGDYAGNSPRQQSVAKGTVP